MRQQRQAAFMLILNCILSSYTVEQLEACERMLRNTRHIFQGLSEMALLKKCTLMIQVYPEKETQE